MQSLKRGDVWWVSFGPSVGGEVRKTRPAVIVSNNAANAVLNRVVVVPLTSRTGKVYPSEVLVHVEGRESKAMANQITTAARERLQNRMGVLSPADLRAVEDAILLHLSIRR
ncbi:MAG: type II toxin-antitoxin system PemK/MazF family toxin [Terriglobia bacterium]|jgi:mRNA interferase MazF